MITISIELSLEKEGIILPQVTKPLASYLPGLVTGELVFVSGQLPMKDGTLLFAGKLGQDLTIEEGQQACRQAAINCLAVLKACLTDWTRLERIVKITGYIQSTADYHEQAKVLNGASDLLMQLFGDAGRHARAAIGVNALPLNAACEIEMIAKINA